MGEKGSDALTSGPCVDYGVVPLTKGYGTNRIMMRGSLTVSKRTVIVYMTDARGPTCVASGRYLLLRLLM